jgi:hypothetical protein
VYSTCDRKYIGSKQKKKANAQYAGSLEKFLFDNWHFIKAQKEETKKTYSVKCASGARFTKL